MAVIFDDQTRQWFMALTLRGESFSMPLGDPLPMEREGGCSEDQLGLDLPPDERHGLRHEPHGFPPWRVQSCTHTRAKGPKP
jgi:hypothetical protein